MDTGCKTIIRRPYFIQNLLTGFIRMRNNILICLGDISLFYPDIHRNPVMSLESNLYVQTVRYLYFMAEFHIIILEIIQFQFIEIKSRIRSLLDVIQDAAAIYSVTATNIQMENPYFLGPIVPIQNHPPIEFLSSKIIAQIRPYTKNSIRIKDSVILKDWPV